MILLTVVASEDIDLTGWPSGQEAKSCLFFNRCCLTTHGCGRVVPAHQVPSSLPHPTI